MSKLASGHYKIRLFGNSLLCIIYNHRYNMSYYAVELLWVIGFALSSVLSIVIVSYRRYKEYSAKNQTKRVDSDMEFVKRQMETEKWKRQVFRP